MYVSIQYDRHGAFLVRETPSVSKYREYRAYIISSARNDAMHMQFMLSTFDMEHGCNPDTYVTVTVRQHCKLVMIT